MRVFIAILIVASAILFYFLYQEIKGYKIKKRLILVCSLLIVSIIAIGLVVTKICFDSNFQTTFSNQKRNNEILIEISRSNIEFLKEMNSILENGSRKKLEKIINKAIEIQNSCIDASMVLPSYNSERHIREMNHLVKMIDQ